VYANKGAGGVDGISIANLKDHLAQNGQQAAKRVGNSIYLFLKDQLCLPINREKSGIRRPLPFELLGYAFVKLKQLTRKTHPMSFDERIRQLNWLIRTWINYFKLASIHTHWTNG